MMLARRFRPRLNALGEYDANFWLRNAQSSDSATATTMFATHVRALRRSRRVVAARCPPSFPEC